MKKMAFSDVKYFSSGDGLTAGLPFRTSTQQISLILKIKASYGDQRLYSTTWKMKAKNPKLIGEKHG